MKVDGRLLFGVFEPGDIPDMTEMVSIWNRLAEENGLPGFLFFSFAQGAAALEAAHRAGFDRVVYDALFDAVYTHHTRKGQRIKARLESLLHLPSPVDYHFYTQVALEKFKYFPDTVPCVDPNFDHSPRSGVKGTILHNSTPERWGAFYRTVSELVDTRQGGDGLLFIKAWNEWGEGNYLEPDLRYGDAYLKEMVK